MRERCNIEGTDGNLLQNIVFFKVFAQNFRLDGVFQDRNVEWMGTFMFQGQIGKIVPKIPGKLDNFPVLPLFFHLSLPKIWLTHPNKNWIVETIKDRAFISQSLAILTW